jgi:hypothetical protein
VPWNCLFRECLQKGTSVSESGRSASLDRRPGECVLLFKTDCPRFRSVFGVGDRPLSDAVFYYKAAAGADTQQALIFVELKGTDVAHALEQLRTAVEVVRKKMPELETSWSFRWVAVVVTRGSHLKQLDKWVKEFREKYRVTLLVKSADRLSLRAVLGR